MTHLRPCLLRPPDATTPDTSPGLQLEGGRKHMGFLSPHQHREIVSPQALSYLGLFLAFNFAANTKLSYKRILPRKLTALREGKEMSKLSKFAMLSPGSNTGRLMKRCTKAWFLGANL